MAGGGAEREQRENTMSQPQPFIDFPGRIVFIGMGSIGQGVLPLVLRHIGVPAERVTIVSADERGIEAARRYGVRFIVERLARENLRRVLEPLVGRGDFVLNVSVEVSSTALIKLCWERGAMYLDTCIEPWPGGYTDPGVPPAKRTNYALREEALALRPGNAKSPTAVLTHGANPGLVSHFLKQALLNIAADTGVDAGNPSNREDWANLASTLGVRVIHVAERDTQVSPVRKRKNEFVNTWSIDGFVSEGQQPCELGWGSHERNFPRDGRRHDFGCGAAIWLAQPGCATRVRTWTPKAGNIYGFAITHGESISIADYLTIRDGGQVVYRPTVHYAYHPRSQLPAAGPAADPDGRDFPGGYRRARGAARRPQEERLLVRLAAVHRRGPPAGAVQQRHQPAGHRVLPGGHGLGNGEPEPGNRRTRGPRLPPHPRDLRPLPRYGHGRVHRLDPAHRPRAAVRRGRRQVRSLAVQERPGVLGRHALAP
jgi:hypothetical protein